MARRTVRLVGQESSVPLIIFIVATVAALIGCYLFYSLWQAEEMARKKLDANINEAVHKKLLLSEDPDVRGKVDSTLDSPERSGAKTRYGSDFFALVNGVMDRAIKLEEVCKNSVGWDLNAALGEGEGSIKGALNWQDKTYDTLRDMLEALKEELTTCRRDLAQTQGGLKEAEGKLAKETEVRQQAEQGFKKQISELQAAVAAKDEQIKKVEADAQGKVDAAHKEAVAAREELAKGQEQLKTDRAKIETKLNDRLGKVQGILERRGIPAHVELTPDASFDERSDAIDILIDRALTPAGERKKAKEFDATVIQTNLEIGRAYVNIGTADGAEKGKIYTVYRVGKAGAKIPMAKVETIKVEDTFSTVGILEQNPRDPILPGDILISKETLEAQSGAAAPPKPAAAPKPAPPKEEAKEEEKKEEAKEEKSEEKSEEKKEE